MPCKPTEAPMTVSVSPGQQSARLVLDPVFGPFFWGKMLSAAGVWIYNIVAAILVFELSGSALMVGLVSVAQFGPQLVLAPMSGALADRGNRRLQFVVGKMLVACASGGLGVWIWMVGVERLPGGWPVIVTALLVGFGFVLVSPAQYALVPALVHPNELASAVALNSLPSTVARTAGPAIGALVATTVGPAVALVITAVTNIVFAVIMLKLNIRSRSVRGARDARVRIGIRYLKKDRRIPPLLIGVAAIGIGVDPVITLTPSLAAGYGSDAETVGMLASAFGLGAGTSFLILGFLRRRMGLIRLGTTGLLTLAAGMAVVGVSPTQMVALCSLFVAGIGMTMALTALTTQLQMWVPDEVRGRVMALWSMAFLGSRPIAAAFNGSVADATAPAVAFFLIAAVVTTAAWWTHRASMDANPGCDAVSV